MNRFVAYYGPSTNGHGDSGADLAAQRAAAETFAAFNGGQIAAEHVEVDCGKRSTWPKLAEAITETQRVGGTLVVAKLDRLARNAAFTRSLKQSGVDFVCCDNPSVSRLTIHVLVALADDISVRTKVGLNAAKERGVKLGSARERHWEGREDRRREGIRKGQPKAAKAAAEARSRKAREAYSGLMPNIIKMREEEGLTLAEIAERINAEGHKTRAGLPFSASMIIRLLQRAGATESQPSAPPSEPADFSDLPLLRLYRDPAGAAEI